MTGVPFGKIGGAKRLGALGGRKHISLLTSEKLRGAFVAINTSLLRSEEQFQVTLDSTACIAAHCFFTAC